MEESPTPTGERPVVVYAVTVATSAYVLLRGQLEAVRDLGFRVVLMCSPDERLAAFAAERDVEVVPLPMTRGLLAPADLRSLVRAVVALRRLRPVLTNVSTPKAALVVGIAAWLARVPVRVYSLWGLRLEGERPGTWRYRLLHAAERCTAAVATEVLCAGASLRARAVALGVVGARARVLGHGSTNGVDLDRFRPPGPGEAAAARQRLGLPPDAFVVGFVGRIVRDKGVEALLEAFDDVARDQTARLLLVGAADGTDPLPPAVEQRLRADERVVVTGVVDPAPHYHAMDVFVLPSRREGLPNVSLEAGACGLPVVTTTATGCPDAVDPGRSALVVGVDDAAALGAALRTLTDVARRAEMGRRGREFVAARFAEKDVWAGITQFYRELLVTVPTLR